MRADAAQFVEIADNFKSKVIIASDAAFPDVAMALHLLRLQGRMTGILQEESELLFSSLLDRGGQGGKFPDESRVS